MKEALLILIVTALAITTACAQSIVFDIGGRTATGGRSFINIFGGAGMATTTGTVTDTVGGESFTATFSLSVASADPNPVIAYRENASADTFIGVASETDGQLMNSTHADQVTISLLSIDNPKVGFDGFTKATMGNIGATERATINGISTGNITGGLAVDLTTPPHHMPASLVIVSVANTSGGATTHDVGELGLGFSRTGDPGDTTPPEVPGGLALATGNGTVTLTWNDNSEPDLANYRVYRRTTASGTQLVGAPTASEFTDTGLHNGFLYTWFVTASDLSGNESGSSSELAGTPGVPGDDELQDHSGHHFEDFIGFPHLATLPGDLGADSDGDGESDSLEFALGSDKDDAGQQASPTISLGPGDGSPPVVTYRERISSPGVHAVISYSADLRSWSSNPLTELSRVLLPDGWTAEVTVRLDDPSLPNTPRVFARVAAVDTLYSPRFAIVPEATTTTTISMTAGEADLDPRSVEYSFEAVSGGGNDSGWQRGRLYIDSGLAPGTTCSYQVRLRRVDPVDGIPVPGSETAPSLIASATTPISGNRPNIILFMADDVGYECFDIYGDSDHHTPRITQMAAEGVKFTNFHSQPLCTPSRVQIMSGQYNQRSGTTFGDYEPDKCFASFFKQAGYLTCIAGKWQLDYRTGGNPATNPALPQRVLDLGFDEFLLWNISGGSSSYYGSRYWSPTLYTNPASPGGNFTVINGTSSQYGPTLVRDFINSFATTAAGRSDPFFIYCPLIDPHDPFVTPPGFSGLPTNKAKHQAMVEYLDQSVGQTLDLVRNTPSIADNTLVIFTGDNGTNTGITTVFNGADYRGGKAGSFDPGTHVPFVAWGLPDIPAGSVSDDLADMTDILPTICDVAGVPIDRDHATDGRSLRSQFIGRSRDPRRWVYGYYFDSRNPTTRRMAWVRNKHYKLYQDGLDHTGTPYVGATRGNLYDVINDERETSPLPGPQPGSRLEALKSEFQAVLDRMDQDNDPGEN